MIRYADDKAVVSNSEKSLQKLMDRVSRVKRDYDMKINVKKTRLTFYIATVQNQGKDIY